MDHFAGVAASIGMRGTRASHRLSLVVPRMPIEEDNVAALVAQVQAALDKLGWPWQLILVDDGSADRTADRIRQAVAAYPAQVCALILRRNFGQTAAMQAGIDIAQGSIIATMDGDLQNNPADIGRMVRRLPVSRGLAFLPPFLLLAAVMALPAALRWFGPAIGVLCSVAVGGLLLPALAQLQQGPVKDAALYARQQGLAVRTWQFNAPSFSVYRSQVAERAATPLPGEVLLTRSSALAALGPAEILYRKGGVVLVKVVR